MEALSPALPAHVTSPAHPLSCSFSASPESSHPVTTDSSSHPVSLVPPADLHGSPAAPVVSQPDSLLSSALQTTSKDRPSPVSPSTPRISNNFHLQSNIRLAPQPSPPVVVSRVPKSSTLSSPTRLPQLSFANVLAGSCSSDLISQHAEISSKDGYPAAFFSNEGIDILSQPLKLALVGKFPKGRPNLDIIRKFIWNLKLRGGFTVGHLDNKHILIKFQLEIDYARCFAKKIFKIAGLFMFMLKWSTSLDLDIDSLIIPSWVSYPNMRLHFFNKEGLLLMVKTLGNPLMIDNPTLNMSRPSVARILVELDVSATLPSQIWLGSPTSSYWKEVVYNEFPKYCDHCKFFGHKVEECKKIYISPHPRFIEIPTSNGGVECNDRLATSDSLMVDTLEAMVDPPTLKVMGTSPIVDGSGTSPIMDTQTQHICEAQQSHDNFAPLRNLQNHHEVVESEEDYLLDEAHVVLEVPKAGIGHEEFEKMVTDLIASPVIAVHLACPDLAAVSDVDSELHQLVSCGLSVVAHALVPTSLQGDAPPDYDFSFDAVITVDLYGSSLPLISMMLSDSQLDLYPVPMNQSGDMLTPLTRTLISDQSLMSLNITQRTVGLRWVIRRARAKAFRSRNPTTSLERNTLGEPPPNSGGDNFFWGLVYVLE